MTCNHTLKQYNVDRDRFVCGDCENDFDLEARMRAMYFGPIHGPGDEPEPDDYPEENEEAPPHEER